MQAYDIIIIGGGITGMSAALTAARLGASTAILTGGIPGGELLNIEKVDGVPGHEDGIAGYDFCPITQELADGAGAVFVMEQANAIAEAGDGWKITSQSGEFSAKAVILAMGAKLKKLGVAGEEEFAGRGVSHCATCDGPLLRGKIAVVAGGGDSAMQEALTLAAHVEKVVMVEASDALTGQTPYVEQVEANPKIEVMTGQKVSAILGEDKVSSVQMTSVSDGAQSAVAAQGLFAFIGLQANIDPAADLVALDDRGRVAVDASLRTSAKGIFAAGNLRSDNGWRAAAGMGDGATAAVAASEFCKNGIWPV